MKEVLETDLLTGVHFSAGNRNPPFNPGSGTITTFASASSDSPVNLAIVAYGKGERKYSKSAAEVTVNTIVSIFKHTPTIEPLELFKQSFNLASKKVMELQNETGVSCVAVVIMERRLYIASCGDSRIFFVRQGQARPIAIVHTFAEALLERGDMSIEKLLDPSIHVHHTTLRIIGIYTSDKADIRLRLDAGESDGQSISNQGLALQPSDQIILSTNGGVWGHFIRPDDWRLFENAFLPQERHPQMCVDQFVHAIRQESEECNINLIALKVPADH